LRERDRGKETEEKIQRKRDRKERQKTKGRGEETEEEIQRGRVRGTEIG
jgi:hypothetical protein